MSLGTCAYIAVNNVLRTQLTSTLLLANTRKLLSDESDFVFVYARESVYLEFGKVRFFCSCILL